LRQLANLQRDSLIYGENRRNDVTSKILPRKVTPLDSNTTEVSLSLYLEYTFLGRLLKRSILKRITKMWQNKLESQSYKGAISQ
jgi:hypothetical protein